MLLPVHEEENIDEDPRMDIIKPLEEYLQIKSAAELLANRNLLGEDIFTRNPGQENHLISPDDEMVKVGLFELIDAFQRILERISPHTRMDITADTISVKDKISQLVDVFEARGSITFDELFSESVDRSEVIVTFLAILEMVKLYLVRIAQHAQSGVIRLFYI
jgi:segregation and condensation protein A